MFFLYLRDPLGFCSLEAGEEYSELSDAFSPFEKLFGIFDIQNMLYNTDTFCSWLINLGKNDFQIKGFRPLYSQKRPVRDERWFLGIYLQFLS